MPSNRPLVVGISGASCSGKSWLAEKILAQQEGDGLIIGLDGYYRDLSEVSLLEFGHDNPASIHADRALEDLLRLKSGQAISLPVYNYEQQRVIGFSPCEPCPLILVEGLFVFADRGLRNVFDLKIWVETADELRWSRRIQRDTACRELQLEDIQIRYERDVLPGYRKYIQPLREFADIIVQNDGQNAQETPVIARLLQQWDGANNDILSKLLRN